MVNAIEAMKNVNHSRELTLTSQVLRRVLHHETCGTGMVWPSAGPSLNRMAATWASANFDLTPPTTIGARPSLSQKIPLCSSSMMMRPCEHQYRDW